MGWLGGAFLAALVVTYGLTPLARRLALHYDVLDVPDERKVHEGRIPRLGGVAIYVGFIVASILAMERSVFWAGLLVSGSVVFLLGLVDDIRGIRAQYKLLGQIAAAMCAVAFGIRVEFLSNPFDGLIVLGNLAVPVTVLWIVGVTNALNLIDGLDGLAAGTAAIASLTIALVSWLEGQPEVAKGALILAGCALGFLRYNFHPASIFMGDSGSMFLGLALAVLSVQGLAKSAAFVSLFVPAVILGLPLLDTFMAIWRRFGRGESVFCPDKQHLHHCLLDLGLSQRQSVGVIYGVNSLLALLAVLLTRVTSSQGIIIVTMVAVAGVVAANKLVTTSKARRKEVVSRGEGRDYLRG